MIPSIRTKLFVSAACVTVIACHGAPPPRSPVERADDAAASVKALQDARFAAAVDQAGLALARDGHNARAAAVRAIASYQAAGSQLVDDLGRVLDSAEVMKAIDHASGRAAWQRFADRLASIDRDLAIVAADPAFSLELCIACWEHDWNRNGEIDDRDRRLFEIELDGRAGPGGGEVGDRLPEGDPRRRPTFRFDVGDADWARAMISFQRAAMELILAYRWSELDRLGELVRGHPGTPTLEISLHDAARVQRARALILAGLGYADRSRVAYLAESDDDREWVPNPNQQSHPVPLAVDASLYQTWADLTGDVRRMLTSEEGLSLRALAALGDDDGAQLVPDAFLDLGALLRQPTAIRLDVALLAQLDHAGRDPAAIRNLVEQLLRGLFGNGYVTRMKPSPMIGRLSRMKRELTTGGDTFERKLRYLLWLN